MPLITTRSFLNCSRLYLIKTEKMKKLVGLSILVLSVFLISMKGEKKDMLAIGASMPDSDLKMLNIDNKEYSLNDIAGKNGILVIFSCNTCPVVIGNGSKSEGWEGRYPALGDLCKKMDIGMTLINSNQAKRNGDDSFEEMQKHYLNENYNCFYLVDNNSALADEFGALTTPHVFLFDANHKLVYRGAIDDNVNHAADVKDNYLIDAINNMLNGNKISPEITKQLGCSIKRI
jgi:hypothetical protein